MSFPKPHCDERCDKVFWHLVRGLKIAIIVTVYFSICALIILLMIGARP